MSQIEMMAPISLQDIGNAKLLSRIDTKFLTSKEMVAPFIEMATRDYLVLQIDGKRLMAYGTCYFDTSEASMYHDHQRGKRVRQKVRIRSYEDGDKCAFLEVKDKNNKGKTKKTRLLIKDDIPYSEYEDFVEANSNFTLKNLIKHIENRFSRITLVRNDLSERITIDTDIRFHNLVTGFTASLPDISVIEWKHCALSQNSPMKGYLRILRVKESGFSKYVVGMAETNPALKINRIKNKLRMMSTLAGH